MPPTRIVMCVSLALSAALDLYSGSNKLRANWKWYDAIVIATSYIGPMAKP